MAGLTSDSTAGQALLIAEVRWRLARNALRTTRGKLELLGQAIGVLLGTVAGLLVGIGLGVLAYASLQPKSIVSLAAPFWVVFVFWQIGPLVLAMASLDFNLRGLLHFPLRFSSYVLISVVYGLADPVTVTALFWLACIAVGFARAAPGAGVAALAVILLFAATNLLISRAVMAWLARILAKRRSRELIAALAFLGFLAIQFLAPLIAAGLKSSFGQYLRLVVAGLQQLPPSLAGRVLKDLLDSAGRDAAVGAAGLALYGAVFLLLLLGRLRAQYRGEELSEARAPAPAAATVRAGLWLPGLPDAMGALVEKELRYFFRNPPLLLNAALPVFIVFFLAVPVLVGESRVPERVAGWIESFLFPMVVGYALLVLVYLAYNTFAFDGPGVQLLLLSPVEVSQVLAAKNLVHGLIIGADTLLAWVAISLLVRPPGLPVTLATLAALPLVLLVNYAAGNLLSIHFPRRWVPGTFRRQQPPAWSALTNVLVLMVSFGVVSVVFSLSLTFGTLGTALGIFLVLDLGAFSLYRLVLEQCSRLALEKRELLLTELCR